MILLFNCKLRALVGRNHLDRCDRFDIVLEAIAQFYKFDANGSERGLVKWLVR